MPLHEEPIHSLHVTSPSLSSLTELPEKYAQRLQKAGFTKVSEIILISPDSLKSQTGLSSEEVEQVYQILSELCSPKVTTISERMRTKGGGNRHSFISLGAPDLDQLFGNNDSEGNFSTKGIPTGLITEIAGESACGKTCMSLQLSLNVQLPCPLGGLEGGCIYLCTESAFPASRLHEMAVGLCDRWKKNSSLSSLGSQTLEAIDRLDAEDLMDNVHLLRAQDPQTLIHSIHYSLPVFLERQNVHNQSSQHACKTTTHDQEASDVKRKPIKLIILDSIGAIFRADVEQNKVESTKFRMTERASEMNQVADGLKFLADRYQLAVVIVNQVSDVIDQKQESNQLILPTNNQQPPHSPSNLASTPDSFGTLTPSTPNDNEPSEKLLIVLDYNQQARHFNGQKVTNNRKEAALGLAWANAINIRIMLNKLNTSHDLHQQALDSINPNHHHPFVKRTSLTIREAVIVFSPFGKTSPDRHVQFVIISQGIVSVNDLSNQISSS